MDWLTEKLLLQEELDPDSNDAYKSQLCSPKSQWLRKTILLCLYVLGIQERFNWTFCFEFTW